MAGLAQNVIKRCWKPRTMKIKGYPKREAAVRTLIANGMLAYDPMSQRFKATPKASELIKTVREREAAGESLDKILTTVWP